MCLHLDLKVRGAARGHGNVNYADGAARIDSRQPHDLAGGAEKVAGKAGFAAAAEADPSEALRRDVHNLGELAEKVRSVGMRLVDS